MIARTWLAQDEGLSRKRALWPRDSPLYLWYIKATVNVTVIRLILANIARYDIPGEMERCIRTETKIVINSFRLVPVLELRGDEEWSTTEAAHNLTVPPYCNYCSTP